MKMTAPTKTACAVFFFADSYFLLKFYLDFTFIIFLAYIGDLKSICK